MNSSRQPLAEVFGHLITDQTEEAQHYRNNRLCPFNNRVPNCTKDKANDPLGVCSIYHENEPVITCPVRFRQDWIVVNDAATFFFDRATQWCVLTEVRLNDAAGRSAGNVDMVLVAYNDIGKVIDFGALEIQAVYISGNVRDPFEYYMGDPQRQATMDWTKKPNYPRPDYLSSSRKRLVPQLIYKGGIIKAWGKKIAVALNKSFFRTLPVLKQVPKRSADMVWLIYDLELRTEIGMPSERYYLTKVDEVFTEFEPSLISISTPSPGKVADFIEQIQQKFDDRVETLSTWRNSERPF